MQCALRDRQDPLRLDDRLALDVEVDEGAGGDARAAALAGDASAPRIAASSQASPRPLRTSSFRSPSTSVREPEALLHAARVRADRPRVARIETDASKALAQIFARRLSSIQARKPAQILRRASEAEMPGFDELCGQHGHHPGLPVLAQA